MKNLNPEDVLVAARRARILRTATVLGFDGMSLARLDVDLTDERIKTLLRLSDWSGGNQKEERNNAM